MYVKKVRYFLFILFLFIINISFISANEIYSININVVLDSDGNAHIKEVWNMKVDEGTEVYKPMSNLGNSVITNFRVSDELGNYEYQYSWNQNGTLASKARKNGINYTFNGLELCFGMSSYGNHTYTMSYDVSNMIYNVEDAQVLYW